MEPRIPTCKELRAQAAKAAPARVEAVVLEAEAPKNEVQAVPVEAADRLAVVWGVPEPVAAGAAAVEVVAEQGIKSGIVFGLDRCARTFVKNFVSFGAVSE